MLSIVITCRDDRRITRAVRSVDVPVEIVVVLNGSPPGFETWLRGEVGERVVIETLLHGNRARSVEHGIHAAANDRVLLIDTDCEFEPGSIEAVMDAFDRGTPADEVYKGMIVYDGGGTRWGEVVARSRTRRNQRLSAYKPALAFSRTIASRIGGHVFDPRLIWKSDAELDQRIRHAGLSIVPVPGCVVHHAPLSLRSDLCSSFHYGVGHSIADYLGLDVLVPERSLCSTWHEIGARAAAYLLASNITRSVGRAYGWVRLEASAGRWIEHVAPS